MAVPRDVFHGIQFVVCRRVTSLNPMEVCQKAFACPDVTRMDTMTQLKELEYICHHRPVYSLYYVRASLYCFCKFTYLFYVDSFEIKLMKTRKNNYIKFSAMRRNCPSARLRIYLVRYVKFTMFKIFL
jgi:hypothetical protein